MSKWTSLVIVVLLAVVTLAVSGCGKSAPVPASGIIGLMTEIGGEYVTPRAMPNVEIEVRQGTTSGPVVATTKSRPDGTFSLALDAGHYAVVPVRHGDEMVLSAIATVDPKAWVHVKVGFSVR
jgi:hypothetical protein